MVTHSPNASTHPTGADAHPGDDHHQGVHLASWNFNYVEGVFVFTIFLFMAGLVMIVYHHLHTISKRVPESCALIILGVIVGIVVRVAHTHGHLEVESMISLRSFSARTFFIYLLPPIMLDSAYCLHDKHFLDNIGTILLFAVVGTLISVFTLGPTLYALSSWGAMGSLDGDYLSLTQSLVFATIISAVDPVAVLAIFQEVGVNDVLYFLVFGESLLNDAVTVVLYNTFATFASLSSISIDQYFLAFGAFFTVSLGGILIGLVCGFVCSFITKFTNHVRVVEPLTVFTSAYLAYLLAELFHWSGILSIIACGLFQWQYARHNVSKKSYYTIKYFTKMAATVCDAVIFLFFGIALADEKMYSYLRQWHLGFVVWTVLLCLFFRCAIMWGLCSFANRVMRVNKIATEEVFIMCYAGLRGAVGFSLAVTLKDGTPHKSLFVVTTIVVILFTVFFQGITIKPLVSLLRVKRKAKRELSMLEELNQKVVNHVCAGIDMITGHHGRNYLRDVFERFNAKHLKRLLQREPEQKDEEILDFYQKILLHQHFMNIDHSWRIGDEDIKIISDEHPDDDGGETMTTTTTMSPENGLKADAETRNSLTPEPTLPPPGSPGLKPQVSFKLKRDVSIRMPSSSSGAAAGAASGSGAADDQPVPNSKNLHKLFKRAAVSATAYRKIDRDLQRDDFDFDDIIQRRSAKFYVSLSGESPDPRRSFRRRRSTYRESQMSDAADEEVDGVVLHPLVEPKPGVSTQKPEKDERREPETVTPAPTTTSAATPREVPHDNDNTL